MTKKTIFKDFSRYVSLSVASMVFLSVYILVDTYFVAAALGQNGLAALNISIAVFSVMHSFGLMIGIGGATHYAIQKSKGGRADGVFTHALVHGLAVAAIFVIAAVLFTPQAAQLLGADEATFPMVVSYMRTILMFSPVFMANSILGAFIRNDNNPKLAMAGMVTASILNIILDYFFLFPLSLGMMGAALATGLANTAATIILVSHFWTKNNRLKLRRCKIRIKEMLKMDALGASALINELAFAVSLIVFNLVILSIEGNMGVAAFGVIANIAVIITAIFTGVAQGIQPLVSKGHGLGDRFLVNRVLRYALITIAVIAAAVYVVVFFNAGAIASVFNSEYDAAFIDLAAHGLRIYFIGLLFAGVNIISSAFFSAVDNAKKGLAISLLRSCVINVPMVIILGAVFKITGVWTAYVLTEVVVACAAAVFFYIRFKTVK